MNTPSAAQVSDSGPEFVSGGQTVFASNVLQWLTGGFGLFTRSPGIWIVNCLILLLFLIAAAIIPVVGSLASNLLGPVFVAGVMFGCRTLDNGGELQVEHLFVGFKDKAGQLVLVGLLLMVGTILALILIVVVMAIGFGGAIFDAISDSQSFVDFFREQGLSMIGVLIVMSIGTFLPLAMASWFAPLLVMFHNQDALSAMKQSFLGCVRNIAPGIVYFVLLFVLLIIGATPLGLGLLVVFPMMYGSMYMAYKDIFLPK